MTRVLTLWGALPVLFTASLLLTASLRASESDEVPLERFEFTQVQMGMDFKLTFYAADKSSANRAAAAAYARIGELNAVMSDYDPASELSKLSKSAGSGQAVPVSADLWQVLTVSQRLAEETEGAFDITVGPLVRLWRRSRRERELPSAERLAAARAAVGHQLLTLDEEQQTATLSEPQMRLDLGGIAAGFAADEALAVLARHGIRRVLIDASGDLLAGDPPPGEPGWKIGIAPLADTAEPSRYVWLARRAISTSGDAFQFVEIEGVRYSHIVDPQTGLGLTTPLAVVVVAPDCMTADSLATAVSVLGVERGLEFVERNPTVAALFVEGPRKVGLTEKLQPRVSSRFEQLAPRAK
jgi:thiamine biosynthesis lipoprotein